MTVFFRMDSDGKDEVIMLTKTATVKDGCTVGQALGHRLNRTGLLQFWAALACCTLDFRPDHLLLGELDSSQSFCYSLTV